MRWTILIFLLAGCASTAPATDIIDDPGDAIVAKPRLEYDPAFDWIQLVSGEWLKGEITVLRADDFEFDSDELDDLTFDWEDVIEVHSKGAVTATFDNPADATAPLVYTGKLSVDKQTVRIGRSSFPREDLISVIPGEANEWDYWSGKFTFNLTARSGNTDQVDVGLYGRLLRQSPDARLDLVYRGNYGRVEDLDTVDNHLFTGTWDLFVSRAFFVTPAKVEVYSDKFQNLAYRVTPSAGGGYHVIDVPGMEWDVTAGLGWQFTKYDSVEPGEDRHIDQGIAWVGTKYAWDITSDTDLLVDYSAQLGLDDLDDSTQHLGIILSSDLWYDLEIDLGFYWDWVGSPTANADGETPEKSDYRLTVGIGWEF